MSSQTRADSLAAYRSVASHGGVEAADPHRLILLLLDGALDRIASARGAMARGEITDQARLLHRAVAIIHELRGSLDLKAGGALALNLDALYDYCCRQLLRAGIEKREEPLNEVANLLHQIRIAWIALPAEFRTRPPAPR
jgi:flagellar secretion chaperone FliS